MEKEKKKVASVCESTVLINIVAISRAQNYGTSTASNFSNNDNNKNDSVTRNLLSSLSVYQSDY